MYLTAGGATVTVSVTIVEIQATAKDVTEAIAASVKGSAMIG